MAHNKMSKGESFLTGSRTKEERMATYLEWLLTPIPEREPKTKKELASELGVSATTLRNYSQEPSLQSDLARRSRETSKVEELPAILATLARQATDPDNPRSVSAAKLLLDYFDRNQALNPNDGIDMSDHTMEQIKQSVLQELGLE